MDILVTKRRDKSAAKCFFRRILKYEWKPSWKLVTDELRSYSAAHREIFFNPHLIVSKALRLIGLSNHPFTACGPSLDLMLRYQDQMPLDRFVTHRFSLE